MTFRSSTLLFALLAAWTPLHAQDKDKSKKGAPGPTPVAQSLPFLHDTPPASGEAAPAAPVVNSDSSAQPDAHSKAPGNVAGAVPDGVAQMVAQFFVSLQKNEVDAAYANLTKGSQIAEKPQELKQLKQKTQVAIEVFGAINGYDLVDSKSVGSRLVRTTYASHGKVYPLRWRFYFYKPDDTWRLIDMRVDDKLSGMFDEPEDAKNSEAKPQ